MAQLSSTSPIGAAPEVITTVATPAAVQPVAAPKILKGKEIISFLEGLTEKKLEELPEISWNWIKPGKFSRNYNIVDVDWKHFIQKDKTEVNIAKMVEGKKVIAVAVRYFDKDFTSDKTQETGAYVIKVLSLANRLTTESKLRMDLDRAYFTKSSTLSYSVQDTLTEKEIEKLDERKRKIMHVFVPNKTEAPKAEEEVKS